LSYKQITPAFTKRDCSRSSTAIPVISSNDFKEDSFRDENSESESASDRLNRVIKEDSFRDENSENESAADRLNRVIKEADIERSSPKEIENDVDVLSEKLFDGDVEANASSISQDTPPEQESIISRLRRLSMTAAEEFVPSPMAKAAREKLKDRHSKLSDSYTKKYPHRSNQGFNERGRRDDDFGGYNKFNNRSGGGYNDFDGPGSNSRRYFSTNSTESTSNTFVDEADVFGTIAPLKKSSDRDANRVEVVTAEQSIFEDEDDDIKFKPDNGWTQRKLRFKIKELAREHKVLI